MDRSRAGPGQDGPTLLLACRLPHPPRSGGDLRVWQAVRGLRARGPVTVVGLGRDTPPPAGFSPADWISCGFEAEAVLPPHGMLAWLRDPDGHPADRWFTPRAERVLHAAVARVRPRAVVLETLFLHRYVPGLRELGCRVVLDAHNLEGPLHAELVGAREDVVSRAIVGRLRAHEQRAFGAVDQVWVCSERDAARAAELYPAHAPLAVVPNTVDVAAYGGPEPAVREPAVLFAGTLGYPPNERALRRLLDEIWPAVHRARPDVRLVVLGGDPPAWTAAAVAAAPGRVELTGSVSDAVPYLRAATATVVPLAEGGGTRLKVLEAFAAGLPVVSTAKGVEGLGLRAGEHYVAAEDSPALAAALVDLLADEGRRTELARAGRAVVTRRYDARVATAAIAAALDQLEAGAKTKSLT